MTVENNVDWQTQCIPNLYYFSPCYHLTLLNSARPQPNLRFKLNVLELYFTDKPRRCLDGEPQTHTDRWRGLPLTYTEKRQDTHQAEHTAIVAAIP